MMKCYKTIIIFLIIINILCPAIVKAKSVLLNFNEEGAGGTTWPGWTWYPPGGEGEGADTHGHAGWRRNDHDSYWLRPRLMEKTDNGNDALALVDTTERAPSTLTGASLKVYDSGESAIYEAEWWYLYAKNFGTQGLANSSTNRFSFYFKTAGITVNPQTESWDIANYNIHLGTYLCWEGGGFSGQDCATEADNQHYYHYLTVHNDTWLHVLLDRHPQHQRSIKGHPIDNPASPKNYYEHMNSFYLQIVNPQDNLTSYWVDEMEFYTETQEENDNSICSVWVGYWQDTDKWEIGWRDGSFGSSYDEYSGSTFEVRYSTEPITNANYGSATIIEPEFHEVDDTNLIRRPHTYISVAWTRFELPDAIEQNNKSIYFAIKDVSVKDGHVGPFPYQYGDGHDAPSSYIHTIDYVIRKPTATANATPTTGPAPLEVKFTYSGSGGNPPYNYLWNFGDTTILEKTNQNPNIICHETHTYSSGNYTATFTVTDSSGVKDTSKIMIPVSSPIGGYVDDNTIPREQIISSEAKPDGDGIIIVKFKIKDPTEDLCTLHTFQYSVDDGNNWSAPVNGDNSKCLNPGQSTWYNNGGNKYSSKTDFTTGTVHSFIFDTEHADVSGFEGENLYNVRIRFKINDGSYDSPFVTSERFKIYRIPPPENLRIVP